MDKSKASWFFGLRPTCGSAGWLGVAILLAATGILNPAYGSEDLATTSAQCIGCETLQEQSSPTGTGWLDKVNDVNATFGGCVFWMKSSGSNAVTPEGPPK